MVCNRDTVTDAQSIITEDSLDISDIKTCTIQDVVIFNFTISYILCKKYIFCSGYNLIVPAGYSVKYKKHDSVTNGIIVFSRDDRFMKNYEPPPPPPKKIMVKRIGSSEEILVTMP